MPVTIKPSSHGANLISDSFAIDATGILPLSSPAKESDHLVLLQSSFGGHVPLINIKPSMNGFVHACIDAYSKHRHLSLRPEDVWFAILTQLSAYINKHAETLRGKFVAHEGKKELSITYASGNRYTVDFGDFAMEIGKLMETNIVDPDLRKWILPDFSTTTETDTVVASILMMASMQSYFSYLCMMDCGIPSVTLDGEKSDWELLLAKLEKLNSLGDEPMLFASLLRPIISRFVRGFDSPNTPEIIDFWGQIFSSIPRGSGMSYFTGWITAFCFWDEKGNCIYREQSNSLIIDDMAYATINKIGIPPGWSKVPVTIDDNGDVFQARMFAGSAGYSCSSSGHPMENGMVGLDAVRPEIGWWIFQDNGESEKETI